MTEEKKPKRKYTRRAKVEPLAVYSVMVKITRGRKVEMLCGESTRVENGCLVLVSMDGPQPLVEKTRYIPLGSAEIEVCQRTAPTMMFANTRDIRMGPPQFQYDPSIWQGQSAAPTSGPQIQPGPLEIARQREAQGFRPVQKASGSLVERNADGVPVVTAGFLDGSPT